MKKPSAELVVAAKMAEVGDLDEALDIVQEHLRDVDPNDHHGLLLASYIYDKAGHNKRVIAYNFAKRAVAEGPQVSECWLNLAKISGDLYLLDEARRAFQNANRYATTDKQRKMAKVNFASCMCTAGQWKEAERLAREALAMGESRPAQSSLGIALLAQGKWEEAWPHYDSIIGTEHRFRHEYNKEKPWNGEAEGKLVVWGEQGLGDEISFASMIPDLKYRANLIIDCDKRLKGLLQRSFPWAKVYGTRWDKKLKWAKEDQNPDFACAMGELGKFFRKKPEDCPGTPYLSPDPDRLAMWKGLWTTKKKPVYGIAWTGGVQWTGAKFRRLQLADLLPVFQAVDAHWVCLQYKDAQKEIDAFKKEHPEIDLVQYPYATLTEDYDDTAALVASLDKVVSMQSAVIHLAGALGVPCECLVYKHSQWRYGTEGQTIPWYQSVRLWRQSPDGRWPILEVAKAL